MFGFFKKKPSIDIDHVCTKFTKWGNGERVQSRKCIECNKLFYRYTIDTHLNKEED